VDHSWVFIFALVSICGSLSLSIMTLIVLVATKIDLISLRSIGLNHMAISDNLNWLNINRLIVSGFYLSFSMLLL
jgi:predicted ferric reductase